MTVALEEHFATQEIMDAWKKVDPRWRDIALKASTKGGGAQRLLYLGSERLAAMDAAGIDVAVLSLTTPGAQNHSADLAVGLARDANDRLAAAVSRQPKRFQGFATLPTPSPLTAAKELERAVRELGLQGAMLHGRTRERNLSEEEFWPILDVADALRAPLYLHPQSPQHGVLDEVTLFYLDRIDMLSSPAHLPRKISDYVRKDVSVIPSRSFSQRYLRWALEVLGQERMLFATDYVCARNHG